MDDRRDEGSMERIREQMDQTRAHLGDTADELGRALSERTAGVRETVGAVRERVDVGTLVQRHPWPAIGLALGLGVALAASGADRAAAAATADGARRATRAGRETVRRRQERARVEQRQEAVREEYEPSGPGLIERLTTSILSAIDADALLGQLRSAAGLPREYSAADVSHNRMNRPDYWRKGPVGG